MPLFFFCSGVFFKEKPIVSGTIKDIQTLLVPWATFSCLLLICSFVMKMMNKGLGPEINLMDENCYVLYYTIWFLLCLFFCRLFYRIIQKIHSQSICSAICIGAYFMAYIFQQSKLNIPFFFDSVFGMLLFYHLGHLFNHYNLTIKRIPMWANILLLMIYVFFVYQTEPLVNIKNNIFPIHLIVLSVIPIIALYQICCTISSRFLAYCGVASLAILGLHHPLFDMAMIPLMNLIHLPMLVEKTLIVSITLIISLAVYRIMVAYTPFLLGKPYKSVECKKYTE